ncbi:unnamed protein product, partial [Prorocentrum cordatum]
VLAENENLRLRLDAAEQRLAMGEQRAGDRGLGAAAAAGLGECQMVDARLLNKPRTFTGLRSEWKTRSLDFEAYVFAAHPRLGDLVNQASRTADVLTAQSEMDAALNTRLYYILVSVTSDVARVEVRKASRGDGPSAWWHLLREFAPKEANRIAAMLGRISRCEFAGPAIANVAGFEQPARECTYQSGDVASDNMKRILSTRLAGAKGAAEAKAMGKDSKGKPRGDSTGKKGDSKGRGRGTRNCHYCGKVGHLAADCRAKKADEECFRKVAALTECPHGQSSAANAASALQGSGAGSQASLAPAVDVSHVAAVLAQLQLLQQRGLASTSPTVHVANISVTDRTDIPTPGVYHWQFGMLYDRTQCDALPVTVGGAVEFDWALFDTGSGCTTCPAGARGRDRDAAPKMLPLYELATGDEVKSMGARIVAAESDGVPLQIEFQVASVQRAIVGAARTLFAEGGHFQILGNEPYMLLTDGGKIRLCRSGKTFWLSIRRPAENVAGPILANPIEPNIEARSVPHEARADEEGALPGAETAAPCRYQCHWHRLLLGAPRINLTKREISVKECDDNAKAERYYEFLGDPLTVLNILEFQSGAIESAQVTTKGPAECAVAVTTAAMRTWRLGVDGEPAIQALVRAAQPARDEETVPHSGPRRDPKSKGAIENANKMVEGMFRTGGIDRVSGRSYGGAVCDNGETVMYKIQGISHHKAGIRWGKAIWVGKANRTDEHLLATAAGRKTARAISGRVGGQRWSKSLFNMVERAPWTVARDQKQHRCHRAVATSRVRSLVERGLHLAVTAAADSAIHSLKSCRQRIEGAPSDPMQQDAVELLQLDGIELGMIDMDSNVALTEAKRGPTQKVIAGLCVDMPTAVLALTCDAIPRDNATDISKQGRGKEHRQMEEFQVFGRVPKHLAKGERVRGKWIHADEGGKLSARSRFVAMQFAWDVREGTFAGAPLLAAFRPVAPVASSLYSTGVGCEGMIALYGGPVAFIHARSDADIHAASPRGEEPEGIVYQLTRGLYGTRLASFLFQILIMEATGKGVFVRVKVTVQVYDRKGRLLMVIVHGGDFQAGFGIQHDRKHAKIPVSTMLSRKVGESSSTKRAITLSSKTTGKNCRESSGELSTEHATTYRSVAPTALHVAHDRFDIQQAVGYLMRGMVGPTWHHWLLPQRLASYLEQRPQFELFFRVPK